MRVIIDLVTYQTTVTPSPARVKRGDDLLVEVQFRRDGQPTLLPDGSTLEFAAKLAGQPGSGFVIHEDTFTSPLSPTGFYTLYASANTQQLINAFGISESNVNGTKTTVALEAEVCWVAGGHPQSSQTIKITAENDINRGDEGDPTDADPEYPPANTVQLKAEKNAGNGYCGLDANAKIPEARLKAIPMANFLRNVTSMVAFKALPTVGFAGHEVVSFDDSDGSGALATYVFDITSGETTGSGDYPTWVRANDYDADDNPGAWRLLHYTYFPNGAGDAGDTYFDGAIYAPRGLLLNGSTLFLIGGAIGQTGVASLTTAGIGPSLRRLRFIGTSACVATFSAIVADGIDDQTKFHVGSEVFVLNQGTAILTVKASDASTLAILQPGDAVLAIATAAAVTWKIIPLVIARRDGGTAHNATTTGATNVDARTGANFQNTLTGNSTLTPTNMVDGQRISLLVKQDGTGGRTLAWSGVTWPGGVTPSQTSTASKADLYQLEQINGTIYGRQVATNL